MYSALAVALFALAWQQGQEFDLIPEARYRTESPEPLTRVVGAALDGASLLVGDDIALTVVKFDSTGRQVERIGRRGSGPGEFQSLTALGMLGDTLWTIDYRLGRVSLFRGPVLVQAIAGDVAEQVEWPRFSMRLRPLALLRQGMVAMPIRTIRPGTGTLQPIQLLGPDGKVLAELAELDRSRNRLVLRGPRGMIVSTYQPFDDSPLWAVAPSGERVVVVHRPAPRRGAAAAFRLTVHDVSDSGSFVYACVAPEKPVPEDVRNSAVRRVVEEHRDVFDGARAAREAATEALYLPDSYPPVDRILVGADDRIWLRESGRDGRGSRWHVLDDSTVVGPLTGPPDLDIIAATDAHVWGVTRDSLDRIEITRYRISDAEPPTSPWTCRWSAGA